MTTIRPNPFAPPPVPQKPDAARLTAQQAFFAMATGQTPPAAPAPAPAASVVSRTLQVAPPAGDSPAKILRPGSLLDIRI